MRTRCEPQPPDACIEDAARWVDEDQDGYVEADDCNHDNDRVHPLAFDRCNDRDDDCDEDVDEGWLDVDGDGNADCETTELCNGVDDDADGRIDEGFDDFDGDNPDLSIPSPAPLPWTVHNVFRARPVVDTVAVDLTAEITDVCISSCQAGVGVADIQVRVHNVGSQSTYSGVDIGLYAVDGTTWTWLDQLTVTGGVESGESVGFLTFSVPVEQLGAGGLAVRVDDDRAGAETDGRVTECFEDNNVDTWPYRVCGP